MRTAVPAVVLFSFAALTLGGCDRETEQPIPFNHNLHVTRGELECDSCHEYVLEEAFAGLPPVKICMRCHKNEDPENPASLKYIQAIRQAASDGGQIGWVRLYELPRHVYFSHRRHTDIGGLDCKECHGDMAALTAPPPRPVVRALTMEGCIACHDEKNVDNDCSWCHR